MDIYLVRHGQTDGNVAKRHQHPDIGLNEFGSKQAKAVADFLQTLKPTHLITSTNRRAIETTTYIAGTTNLIPITSDLFIELKRPAFLIGKRFFAKDAYLYAWQWFKQKPEATYHDGESYADLLKRIQAAKAYLQSLPEDSRVIVVSHAVFINFFIAHLRRDRPIGYGQALLRLLEIFSLRNTAVIKLRYRAGQWRFLKSL